MKILPMIALAIGISCSGCAQGVEHCPATRSGTISSLKSGGFTGALDADIELVGKSHQYCFFRYEYVFGESGRMSSRLIVFSHGRYLGSYAFSFADLKVDDDQVLVELPSGVKHSIMIQSIGSKLLIDGEPLTFYK